MKIADGVAIRPMYTAEDVRDVLTRHYCDDGSTAHGGNQSWPERVQVLLRHEGLLAAALYDTEQPPMLGPHVDNAEPGRWWAPDRRSYVWLAARLAETYRLVRDVVGGSGPIMGDLDDRIQALERPYPMTTAN